MERDVSVPRTKSKQKKNRVHAMQQTIYIQEKEVKTVKTFNVGLNVRCQERSGERCKQQSKDSLVKVEGNYWGEV